jgi:hypothetical protein
MVTALLVFCVIGLGFRSAWYSATEPDADEGRTLWGLAVYMLAAFALSSAAALLYCATPGGESGFDKISGTDIVKIMVSTSIAWPPAFYALLTCLKASRASFLDWGCVPVFGLLTTFWLVPSDWATMVGRPMAVFGLMACVAVTLVGIGLILSKVQGGQQEWRPSGSSLRKSLVVGVGCALVSSCFGLLAVHFTSQAVGKGMPPIVALPIRLCALFPVIGIASVVFGNRCFAINKKQTYRALKFASLTLLPLFALFEAKVVSPMEYTAKVGFWLATIPIWVFAFEVWVFHRRKTEDVPIREYLGMACILASVVMFEVLS